MRHITQALRWARVTTRRLRSLINDEDHDAWYDHGPEHEKPPNVGPHLGGFG